MSKATKIWLIVAVVLILVGCILFGGVMAVLEWDFTKLATDKYETNDYEITESFSAISIDTNTADIVFVPSQDEKCSVVCYEQKNATHSVAVKDGTLVIEVVDARKWYEHIGINFGTPKITVSVPQGEYGALSVKSNTGCVEIPKAFSFESIDVSESTGGVKCCASASGSIKIKSSTGYIYVESLSAGALDLSVSTGKVTVSDVICEGDVAVNVSTGKAFLTDVVCKRVTSSGSTSDISLTNVIVAEKLSIERSTGDVRFDKCDAAELVIETDTGDVTGTLLSEKVFVTKTDTGKVKVPQTVTGGRCEITTDTGDILMEIQKS